MRHTPYVADSAPAFLLGLSDERVALYHTAGGNVWNDGPSQFCSVLGLDKICYTDLTRRVVDLEIEERLIDLAAARSGVDRIEIRRRNLIPAAAMPFTNAFGMNYESGDFPAAMETAVTLSDWVGFPARRAEAGARGLLRGIGASTQQKRGQRSRRENITLMPLVIKRKENSTALIAAHFDRQGLPWNHLPWCACHRATPLH